MDFKEYRDNFYKELHDDALISGNSLKDQYLDNTISILEAFDEVSNAQRIYMDDTKCSRNRMVRVDGYSYSDADQTLILYINDFSDAE